MTLELAEVLAVLPGQDHALPRSWDLSVGQVVWQLFLVMFFVLLNGFFVAAEFAIVKVRASQLDASIEEGRAGAKFSRHVVEHLDAYLSATQLGITIASLALGWVGEPYVASLISPILYLVVDDPSSTLVHAASLGIAFSIITFLHIVLGELMPKSLAIRRALGTTLIVSRPLGLVYSIFKPPIWVLNGAANKLLKWFFKIDPISEQELVHSADELRILVEETEGADDVTDTEREILINALELNDLAVRDIMTPRSDVVALDPEQDFAVNLKVATQSKHTRFPLIDGHLDETVGQIHIKDLITLIGQEKPDLRSIARELLPVPEMMPVDRLLKFFLNRHAHLALVVDEFGGALGIVTLDNVLEELVGDIQDEFDEEEKEFERISDDEFLVEGTLGLYELSDHADLELESADVSTVGGYVTHLMGHLPKVGESVAIGKYLVVIAKTDGRRIEQLRFIRREEPPKVEEVSEVAEREGSEEGGRR